MNFIKKVEADAQELEQKIGVFEAKIVGVHAGAVIQVLHNILVAAENPLVEGCLATIIPPAIMAHYPQIEAALGNAIATITQGASIMADVQAAPTTEAKLIVFINDLQKSNAVRMSALLKGVCAEVLAIIDNKALTAQVYAYWLEAEALLANG